MVITGTLMYAAYFIPAYFYINTFSDESRNAEYKNSKHLSELRNKYALDLIDLCINSSKDKDDLSEYYCKRADESYKTAQGDINKNDAEQQIEKKAYGLMKANTNYNIQLAQSEDYYGKNMSFAEKVIYAIFNNWVFGLYNIFVLGGILFVFLYPKKYSPRGVTSRS